ncbi:MAG: DUF262 domain-containing protein [Gammaproteobacteria bacterium]|nr:DUF262 domain-containing protein [Terriglobia bacterium]MYG12312.1 DUF262 domain-containing protein [Gammaproteobacteria bacterium]MYH16746.1 DUF262 domain-containing protein [Gammaproteobacteria bacterium]
MREIRGNAKNLRALLAGAKFAIDYYQREYRWATKQVAELIEDLAEKFRDDYEVGDPRSAVEDYGHYFLGSIIISDRDGRKFIIDGQQRLTTLTLLLIHIYLQLEDDEQKAQVADLIFSMKFGRRSFNLDVDERAACMEALFTGSPFEEAGQPESVANILLRFRDVTELFPSDLADAALPYFADWLIENVHLVEITAYSDADAYTIFETMNDRGLSLTPTDMLKGYLLANIEDPRRRNAANQLWRTQITRLQDLGKEEDADAIKAWLRSQHATSIRERKRGAAPRDFDRIGTEFHRWIREQEESLGLTSGAEFARFIEEDFSFYGRWYARLREAAETLTDGLESVRYCAEHNFTLQYPVLLAPLKREDREEDILRKLRVVSAFLDILISRRIWNWRAIGYSTMQYAMFLVMRDIRGRDASDLARTLEGRLAGETETFVTNDRFRLHGTNGRQIHRLLARMTDYVETQAGRASRYQEYVHRHGNQRYEVEHIWADHPERHTDEFSHPSDFSEYRNRIGGLLLLPKSFNASYGDLPYAEKRGHYLKHNLLAQSLHEKAYDRDPGFAGFAHSSGLPFKPHAEFLKADLDARQELYRQLAETVWNPERLARAAES